MLRTTHRSVRTLARLALGFIAPSKSGNVTFVTKDGVRLIAPASSAKGTEWWWPVVEVLVGDCYGLRQLAPELQTNPCCVLDVGAHIGSFSAALARAVPSAEVTAYEPSAKRVAYLRQNIAANGLTHRVTVGQAAIAQCAGQQVLNEYALTSGPGEPHSEVVDVVAFEDVMISIEGRVDLVKMDCEGSEYDTLASAPVATLHKIDRVVLEYHPAPREQLALRSSSLANAGLSERRRRDALPGRLGVIYFAREVG